MGLLDDMPKSKDEYIERLTLASKIMDNMWDLVERSPLEQKIMGELRKGRRVADMISLTGRQRDAILAQGANYFKVGEYDRAADWMLLLYTIDPLEERALYLLGMIKQLKGDLKDAAQLYVQFLALDATNPEGYMRLGECLLAAREYEDAIGAFGMAEAFCKKGLGTDATKEHLAKMLELAKAQSLAS